MDDREQLNLAICPKCHDTKYVAYNNTQLAVGSEFHTCYRCCVKWNRRLGVQDEPWMRDDMRKTLAKGAYRKWEEAGRPSGRDREFWLAFEKEYLDGVVRWIKWLKDHS